MQIYMDSFTNVKYDVISMFNNRQALCTTGTPDEHNALAIHSQ